MTSPKSHGDGGSLRAGDWAWMRDKLGAVHKVYVHGIGIYGTFATVSYSRKSRNTYQVRVRQLRRIDEGHGSRPSERVPTLGESRGRSRRRGA